MPVAPSLEMLCPSCGGRLTVDTLRPRCESCRAEVTLSPGGGFEGGGPLTRCAACNSEAFYIAKDFNKNLGPVIVGLGCLGFYWGALAGIASLALVTVIDRIVYRLRPEVTVCYACKSIYRAVVRNDAHHGYELTYDETFEGSGEKPRFEVGS